VTHALDTAIAKLATLPPDEQDRVARWLLDELADDERWTQQFVSTADELTALAAEARAMRRAGHTRDVTDDEL
jgi:hypothetical protein